MIFIFQWRLSLKIGEWRMMTLWGVIKDLQIHTQIQIHKRTHNPCPFIPLQVTSACQLCLLHISPYALPSGDVLSSLCFIPLFFLSLPLYLLFCFIFQLPLFLYPRFLISCHLRRVWTVNLIHSMLCWVSGEWSFCGFGNCLWALPFLAFVMLSASLWEHVNCFWTPISVH